MTVSVGVTNALDIVEVKVFKLLCRDSGSGGDGAKVEEAPAAVLCHTVSACTTRNKC